MPFPGGRTPLLLACEGEESDESLALVELLLQRGAGSVGVDFKLLKQITNFCVETRLSDMRVSDNAGRNPLIAKTAHVLLQNVDEHVVNKQDLEGKSPLHYLSDLRKQQEHRGRKLCAASSLDGDDGSHSTVNLVDQPSRLFDTMEIERQDSQGTFYHTPHQNQSTRATMLGGDSLLPSNSGYFTAIGLGFHSRGLL